MVLFQNGTFCHTRHNYTCGRNPLGGANESKDEKKKRIKNPKKK